MSENDMRCVFKCVHASVCMMCVCVLVRLNGHPLSIVAVAGSHRRRPSGRVVDHRRSRGSYHVAQRRRAFSSPRFNKNSGKPQLKVCFFTG